MVSKVCEIKIRYYFVKKNLKKLKHVRNAVEKNRRLILIAAKNKLPL